MSEFNISIEQCEMWRNNPTKNPITGRPIKLDGDTYNELLLKCGQVIQDHLEKGGGRPKISRKTKT